MERRTRWQLILAALLLAGSLFFWFRWLGQDRGGTERAFFYDLSEQQLFTAPRTAVPPIRGINDDEEDGMRAVVVATGGNPRDPAQRRIAYLERYSETLKRQFLARRGEGPMAAGEAGIGRIAAQSHIFVRRIDQTEWYAVNTPEGERIMTEWQKPGADGTVPVVCVP